MRIRDFAKKICEREGKRRQVNIAQVMEILKVINSILGGRLYKIIRSQKEI